MTNAREVIEKGYNAIIQNDETFKIVAGNGNLLLLKHEKFNEITSIEVDKVQKFVTIV